ncbi:hypothetical protein [Bifidobacterium magnum]|uniref:Uncharacterized protein n=1 Tax=Bifidobacterium magnum TaxID=1692 RepID=A0A087B690_9BIFI|nr:hypothetical protein [Bifidobacterium magnum]KFI66540.1 hypothetical protein BMAGN_1448 [Bifidobacterium magnum]
MDLSRLYDGVSPAELGGGFLYDGVDLDCKGPEQLFDSDYVVVVPRKVVQTAHGGKYVQSGDPVKVICSVEGRAQQAGMFSISGAEDKSPSGQEGGGLQEVTPLQIIARQWPGDIHSRVWYKGDWYDTDGSPVYRPSGSKLSNHYEVRCRRVVVGGMVRDGGIPEPAWVETVGGR